MTEHRLMPWIGGATRDVVDAAFTPLVSPNDGAVAAHMIESGAAIIDDAVRNAHAAFLAQRNATVATRIDWLNAAADAVANVEGRIVESLVRAIGKPRRAATFEAKRTAQFLRACAAQLPQIGGEVLPLDATPLGAGRFGFTERVPYGVVAAITPFNAPANLLIQKLAPSLAMGNATVVKPSPPGTETTLILAEAFKDAKIPDGLFNVVPGGRDTARALVAHPLVAAVTMTGSNAAGADIARAAGAKRLLAELGSNAANIVCADADLADAARRIAGAAFEASGQQCISAQRVIVERVAFERFLDAFVAAAKRLKVGPADDTATEIGPMVSAEAATRVEQLVADAVGKGARLVLAPTRQGAILGPAILAEAPRAARLMSEEAFGPVVVVQPVADLEEALALAERVRIRPARRVLHPESRNRIQGVAPAERGFAVDQRGEPLPHRHLSFRRRRGERLRP